MKRHIINNAYFWMACTAIITVVSIHNAYSYLMEDNKVLAFIAALGAAAGIYTLSKFAWDVIFICALWIVKRRAVKHLNRMYAELERAKKAAAEKANNDGEPKE